MHKTQNVLQSELLEEMKADILTSNIILQLEAEHDYIDEISNKFQFEGSKIQWQETLHHFHERINRLDSQASIKAFFDRFVTVASLAESNKVIVIGDSAIEVFLELSVSTLKKYLVDVVTMPQHTYIITQEANWCACFTMEGDMDFGLSPKHSLLQS